MIHANRKQIAKGRVATALDLARLSRISGRDRMYSQILLLCWSSSAMELSPELIGQVFSLSPQDRYELANHLLDSIDDRAVAELDLKFVEELRRRREEMLNHEEIVADWRASLAMIEKELSAERQG
jgi:hypothetical protein